MDSELPQYQCHKKVRALKIKEVKQGTEFDIVFDGDGYWELVFEDARYLPMKVSHRDYFARHHPYAGGYLVVYEDGYKSFSPANVFEDGYTLIPATKVHDRSPTIQS